METGLEAEAPFDAGIPAFLNMGCGETVVESSGDAGDGCSC